MHDRPLTFITGKGGVGKSIVTAALALNHARAGHRTLICELDDHPTMARLFDVRGTIGVEPVRVDERLHVANFRGMPVMQSFLRGFVPSRRVTDLLLRNRVAATFFESAPGVMDAVALDQVAETILAEGFERVIVDLPATGHALTLLRLPASMAEMIGVGDLAARVRRLADVMADRQRTQLLVVTLPEEMPVTETVEFCGLVRENVDIAIGSVIVNATRTLPLGDAGRQQVDACASAVARTDARSAARLRLALRLGSFWHDEDARGVTRLTEALAGTPFTTVPFVYTKDDERDLVEQVAAHLREQTVEASA